MEPTPPRRRRRAARRPAGPPAAPTDAPDAAASVLAVADPLDPGTARTAAGEAPPEGIAAGRTPDHAAAGVATPPHPGPRTPADGPRSEPAAHPVPTPAPPHPPGTPGPPGPASHLGRPAGERRGAESGARRGRPSGADSAERSLRSLVTTRSTQVPSPAAMRAREVALPDVDELAAAEAELVIVRRHYVPPTSLPAGRRPDRRGQNGGGPRTGDARA